MMQLAGGSSQEAGKVILPPAPCLLPPASSIQLLERLLASDFGAPQHCQDPKLSRFAGVSEGRSPSGSPGSPARAVPNIRDCARWGGEPAGEIPSELCEGSRW